MMKFDLIPTHKLSAAMGIALLMTFSGILHAQPAFSSLEEQMNGAEFTAAGLQKLTPDELEALNQWIRSRSLATLSTPVGSSGNYNPDGEGSQSSIEDMEREEFTSRILGPFTGWDGQAVFKLENGMIWAQADDDKFYTKEIQSPEVTIKPGIFGNWYLEIEELDADCKVERIQ